MSSPIERVNISAPVDIDNYSTVEPNTGDIANFFVGEGLPLSGDPVLDIEAAKDYTLSQAPKMDEFVSDALASQEELDFMLEVVQSQSVKEQDYRSALSVELENMLTIDSPDFNPKMVNALRNEHYALYKVMQHYEDNWDEATYGGLFLDAVDRWMLRWTVPWLGFGEDVTGRLERDSDELAANFVDMPHEEFREKYDQRFEELLSEGFFRGDNPFAFMEEMERIQGLGYTPESMDRAFWSGVEGATIVAPMIGAVARLARAGMKPSTFLQRWARIKGNKSADKAAEKQLRANAGTPEMEILADAEAPPNNPMFIGPLYPYQGAATRYQRVREALQGLKQLNFGGSFGRVLTDSEYAGVAATIGERLVNKFSTRLHFVEMPLRDSNRVMVVSADVGRVDGTPFKSKRSAEKLLADKFDKGMDDLEVAPARDGDGWVVRYTSNENIAAGVTPLETAKTGLNSVQTAFARLFGTNAMTDDVILNANAVTAEAGGNLASEVIRPKVKAIRAIKAEGRQAIDRAFQRLRDDPKLVHLKTSYTLRDLERLVNKELKGRLVTKKELNALEAAMELEDLSWFLQADKMLQRFVAGGMKKISTDDFPEGVLGKTVDMNNVPLNAVFRRGDGTRVAREQISGTDQVWLLAEPFVNKNGDEITHIVNAKEVKELIHTDVLSFNSGGRRVRPKARYFVATMGDTPKAFLTTLTEKQARLAVDQINNIKRAIKEGGLDIDDVIAANNDWNPNIEDVADFDAFRAKHNLDFDKDVEFKERGGAYERNDTYRQMGATDWNTFVQFSKRRSDTLLDEFGGSESYDINALDSIIESTHSSTQQYVKAAYTLRSAEALAKRLLTSSKVKIPEGVSKHDTLNIALHSEILGNDSVSRELRHMQDVIKRRHFMVGPFEQALQDTGDRLLEFVFDKTRGKVDGFNALSKVQNKLLTFGFHSTLGMFNVDQLFLQAAHMMMVSGMDPVNAPKAITLIPHVRAVLNMPLDIQPEAIRRIAKATAMTEPDFKELVEFVRSTGRNLVTSDALEHGTPSQMGIGTYLGEGRFSGMADDLAFRASRGGKQLIDSGLFFFRQGEVMSRYSSLLTAWFQYKKLNPTSLSSLSDAGRRWIMSKDSALSFNMTTSQRAFAQSGVGKLPTQWLSYMRGTLEALFIGRGLTKAERARLASAQVLFFGMTGSGLVGGESQDDFAESIGAPAGGRLHRAIKWGINDAIISEISGEQTASSRRFSPLAGLAELKNKLFVDQNYVEVLGGPSATILSDGMGALWRAVDKGFNNHTTLLSEDLMQTLRTIKSVDNTVKAMGIIQNGTYNAKTGTEALATGLTPTDAVMNFLGFKPAEIAFAEELSNRDFKYNKEIRDLRSELGKRADQAYALLESESDEDVFKGGKMLEEMFDIINLMPFAAEDKRRMKNDLLNEGDSRIQRIMFNLLKRQQVYELKTLKTLRDN